LFIKSVFKTLSAFLNEKANEGVKNVANK